MFEVISIHDVKPQPIKVYDVRSRYDDFSGRNETEFLIYVDGEWHWTSSSYYKPI